MIAYILISTLYLYEMYIQDHTYHEERRRQQLSILDPPRPFKLNPNFYELYHHHDLFYNFETRSIPNKTCSGKYTHLR